MRHLRFKFPHPNYQIIQPKKRRRRRRSKKRGELVGLVCGKSSLFSSPIQGDLFLVGSSGKHPFHSFPPHFPSQTKWCKIWIFSAIFSSIFCVLNFLPNQKDVSLVFNDHLMPHRILNYAIVLDLHSSEMCKRYFYLIHWS